MQAYFIRENKTDLKIMEGVDVKDLTLSVNVLITLT